LAKVEQSGWDSFCLLDAWEARQYREAGLDGFFPPVVPRCIEDICYDLKIESGSVLGPGAPPRIRIGHPIGGGTVGASVAIEAGKTEAWKDDNRKKLGRAKTDERHIVVYMDAELPSRSLSYFEPPPTLPNLPAEITHIWLIAHGEEIGGEWNGFDVWRASAKEPWQRYERVFIPKEGSAAL